MSGVKRKRVVGNWKMHGSLATNAALLEGVVAGTALLSQGVAVGVCVPFPYLAQAAAALTGSPVAWGVQDVSEHQCGAYTGDVSAGMTAEFGATLAIVGHSERRAYHLESAALVATKTRRALEAGMTPIVCVGETLEEHESGRTEAVVGEQLQVVLASLPAADAARIVVAYEPVWAIGTGRSAGAAQAQQVHAFLRAILAGKGDAVACVPLLYGGSVKPSNAAELFSQPDIDGGLIGGASLKADEFSSICAAAAVVADSAGSKQV